MGHVRQGDVPVGELTDDAVLHGFLERPEPLPSRPVVALDGVLVTATGGGPFRRRSVVLDRVCLDVVPHEVLAVTGERGAGKTALAAVVRGTLRPEAGRVQVPRGAGLGDLPQGADPALLGRRTAHDLVLAPLRQQGAGNAVVREDRVDDVLDAVRLAPSVAGRRLDDLGPADRRRVGLARAAVLRPRVLLVDDLTGGLDRTGRDDLLDAFTDLHDRFRFAALVLDRDPGVAERLGDRVVRLRGGRFTRL